MRDALSEKNYRNYQLLSIKMTYLVYLRLNITPCMKMGLSFLFAGVGINAVMQICELQSQNKFI